MTGTVIIYKPVHSMDWFLYDNGLRHERVKMALRLKDRHVFMWQSLRILNAFNTLKLKQPFRKTNVSLKKTGASLFSTEYNNERAIFLCKTALSKISVKTNWMGSTKWTYHKKIATDYFTFFWKFNMIIGTSYR